MSMSPSSKITMRPCWTRSIARRSEQVSFFEFTATGFDRDRPAQALRFSLDQGAPFGATIDPETGVFGWTPTATQATATSVITVRVTDDGNPPKSATASFTAAPRTACQRCTLK